MIKQATTQPNMADLLLQATEAEECRRSFALFAQKAWHVIEPGKPFVDNWHLDAIAEHLEAVTRGQIKRLLVNMPPRHGKSSYIDVLWFAWDWLHHPEHRWLCASYAQALAIRDNMRCRRIIESKWFQERYGNVFNLRDDQNAKIKFENDRLGCRQAVSVGSAGTTGEGGDVLLIDDPHPIEQKRSDLKRETVLDWFANTWMSRLNDEATGATVVVGQRVHEQDVSGYIIEGNAGDNWVHLSLPSEYEPEAKCRTFLPSGKLFWQDPRTEDGELLYPQRFPEHVIEEKKRTHGPEGFAAIHQQRPTPAGGGTFKFKHERVFTETYDHYILHTTKGDIPVAKDDCELYLSVDPAISEEQKADYCVIQTWAKTPIKDILLLDQRRDHWSHPDQQVEIQDAFNEDPSILFVAVETVAYQAALFQDLVMLGIPCRPFKPHKDKEARAAAAAIWQQNGKMYFRQNAPWLPALQKEIYKFPKASKDDQVDAISLASIAARSRGPLSDDFSFDEPIPEAAEGPLEPEEDEQEQKQPDEPTLFEVVEELQRDPFAYASQLVEVDVW